MAQNITKEHCLLSLSRQLIEKVDQLREDREAGLRLINEAIRDTTDILEDHDHANS